jgi:hypothetical protein
MELARNFDGKKYMWDGRSHSNEQEMNDTKKAYLGKGFKVQVVEEEKQYFLFSRRLVTEVVVEGQPQ